MTAWGQGQPWDADFGMSAVPSGEFLMLQCSERREAPQPDIHDR
jgi:hypothetical protein